MEKYLKNQRHFWKTSRSTFYNCYFILKLSVFLSGASLGYNCSMSINIKSCTLDDLWWPLGRPLRSISALSRERQLRGLVSYENPGRYFMIGRSCWDHFGVWSSRSVVLQSSRFAVLPVCSVVPSHGPLRSRSLVLFRSVVPSHGLLRSRSVILFSCVVPSQCLYTPGL